MIVRLNRMLDPVAFAEKHPIAHVIVGHYNPHELIDEEGTGQPSYFKVLDDAKAIMAKITNWRPKAT